MEITLHTEPIDSTKFGEDIVSKTAHNFSLEIANWVDKTVLPLLPWYALKKPR